MLKGHHKYAKSLLILIMLFSFPVFSLMFLELILRFSYTPDVTPGFLRTHPERRYELRPNFIGKTYDAKLEVNSYGLRDEERQISTGDESYRIVIFGDSITFGIGVEMEDTFPKQLERQLNDVYEKTIQVFNFGISSYNTVREYSYLKDSFDIFRPSLVIFEFTAGNDTGLTNPPGSPRGINKSFIIRWVKDVMRHLYSYNWLAARYYSLRYKLLFRKVSGANYKISANDRKGSGIDLIARFKYEVKFFADSFQGWIDTQRAFRDIAEFCKKRNIPVIFAVYANNVELSSSLEEDMWYPIIAKVTKSLRAEGIDHIVILDEAFREYSGNERMLWVRPNDAHFSPLAHKLVANELFQYIHENRSLIPSRRYLSGAEELAGEMG